MLNLKKKCHRPSYASYKIVLYIRVQNVIETRVLANSLFCCWDSLIGLRIWRIVECFRINGVFLQFDITFTLVHHTLEYIKPRMKNSPLEQEVSQIGHENKWRKWHQHAECFKRKNLSILFRIVREFYEDVDTQWRLSSSDPEKHTDDVGN